MFKSIDTKVYGITGIGHISLDIGIEKQRLWYNGNWAHIT
jgi:hypothetical protein